MGTIERLVRAALDMAAADRALATLAIDPALLDEAGETVSRAAFAMALNVVLFDGLLARLPSGAAYIAERVASGGKVIFDHGALRTIRFAEGPTGLLPAGEEAFRRLLEPIGYRVAGIYPLPALRMTGRGYRHLDFPETIPQFFVSELHLDQFDAAFGEAAARVFGNSADPLDDSAQALLADFAAHDRVAFDRAAAGLPEIAAAFGRHHGPVALADYEALLAQSAEAAWIATEGNAFNHATDRVEDVDALAARLKAEGWRIKDKVEVSSSGRVRQTALRADTVERRFVATGGDEVLRTVPGSFYEFITRDVDPASGALDLGFDSGNASGIFAMTKAA